LIFHYIETSHVKSLKLSRQRRNRKDYQIESFRNLIYTYVPSPLDDIVKKGSELSVQVRRPDIPRRFKLASLADNWNRPRNILQRCGPRAARHGSFSLGEKRRS